MHGGYASAHNLLLVVSFIFGILGMMPWGAGKPHIIPWFSISWVFFVASWLAVGFVG